MNKNATPGGRIVLVRVQGQSSTGPCSQFSTTFLPTSVRTGNDWKFTHNDIKICYQLKFRQTVCCESNFWLLQEVWILETFQIVYYYKNDEKPAEHNGVIETIEIKTRRLESNLADVIMKVTTSDKEDLFLRRNKTAANYWLHSDTVNLSRQHYESAS
jgi:hypothetical protein